MDEASSLLPEHDDRRVHFDSILREGEEGALEESRSPRWGLLSPRTGQNDHSHRRARTLSDTLIDSYAEIKEMIVETVDEVKETINDGFTEFQEVLHEEIEPVKPREEGDHSQKLGALALAVLVFYKVSGGPFGCEPSVKAGGPFVAILGFIITPIIWCVPEALVTAELGSAYPGKVQSIRVQCTMLEYPSVTMSEVDDLAMNFRSPSSLLSLARSLAHAPRRFEQSHPAVSYCYQFVAPRHGTSFSPAASLFLVTHNTHPPIHVCSRCVG